MIKEMKADKAKIMAVTIVAINRIFSAPRRVWNAELQLAFSPKAPPAPAPVCCNKTAPIKMMDKKIWM